MWLAGFPVGNSLVFIPDDSRGDAVGEVEDFIGPSMDIGFRLKEVADTRRMVVSVELALLISNKDYPENLSLYLSEGRSLKGVIGGREYPVFWVNMYPKDSDELEIQADKLRDCSPEELDWVPTKKYCEQFIKEIGTPLFIPFIPRDPEFNSEPEGYPKEFEKIRKIWHDTLYQVPTDEPEKSKDSNDPAELGLDESIEKLSRPDPPGSQEDDPPT